MKDSSIPPAVVTNVFKSNHVTALPLIPQILAGKPESSIMRARSRGRPVNVE